MKFPWHWRENALATTFMASRCDPSGLLRKNSLVRCDGVSNERVTSERSLAIVLIAEQREFIVTLDVVAAVVVAAEVLAAAVVAVLVVAVVVVSALVVAAVVVAVVVAAVAG